MILKLQLHCILFQFRGSVCRWLSSRTNPTEKSGKLTAKSQSFFAGINLVQSGGGGGMVGGSGQDKSQTLTATLPDSARVSSFLLTGRYLPYLFE